MPSRSVWFLLVTSTGTPWLLAECSVVSWSDGVSWCVILLQKLLVELLRRLLLCREFWLQGLFLVAQTPESSSQFLPF